MKSIRNALIVSTGLVLMVLGDAPPQSPLPFQVVSEAHAIFGVWRRHARRWAVVGTAAVVGSASAASAAAASETAAANQQAAAAQQQAAAAQQQAAAAEQQAAAAQQKAAASTAPPAPTGGGKQLPIGTVVSTLPHGCTSTPVSGVEYYYCGGNFYRAVFQGNSLVYVTAQPK